MDQRDLKFGSDLDSSDETRRSRSVIAQVRDLLGFEPGVQLRSLTTESSFSLAPGNDEGKYVIERELGKGGMGRVYLAFDRDLRRRIAVKVILPHIARSREHLARFVEEAQVTGQLEHPGIPPVHELAINKSGEVFFTLKLMKGRTLKEIIRDLHIGRREAREKFSRLKLLMILQAVCNAVHFAHEKGVVHRDIKPDNIMIGDYGEVQLMDWGLAKVLDMPERAYGSEEPVESIRADQHLVTAHGLVHGTLLYMAPEQAQGRNELIDRRTDVYALGATLYEMLIYLPPKTGETMADLLEECRLGLLTPPSQRAPKLRIPSAREEICMKALEYHPDDRFSTAAELGEAIQVYLDGTKEEERRRAESDQRVADAMKVLREHGGLRQSLREAARLLERTEKEAGNYPTSEQNRQIRKLCEDIEAKETGLAHKYTEAQALLSAALTIWAENGRARRALGDLYLERFLRADAERNTADSIFYSGLIAQVNDGHFDRVLKGNGALSIQTEPGGARMTLHRYEERDAILVPGVAVASCDGSFELANLPMGNYLLVIEKDGFCRTRYPVSIQRSQEIRATVRLWPAEAIPEGFAYVPAGPFIMYGDPHVISTFKVRHVAEVPDFAIGIHPVTCGEYLEFLNSLLASDREEALRRAPRQSESSGHLWVPRDGEFRLPEDRTQYPWSPRLPVFGVSFEDAQAYCRFAGARDGRPHDLPTETEWEKASKGVDGRYYAWGNTFDNAYCNNFYNSRERSPGVVEVYSFPEDCSPYGVRGMVGNVGDWCYFDEPERLEVAAVRGGNWALSGDPCRLSYRRSTFKTYVSDRFGFRLKLKLT
ncbi:MAG TPA: SUMF1/EgtB/PvdO family nonheme iron enzyme [Planctomycetota bacterium]|nr:SUMF1/EgtB/PvdO family nonheme iron enzyme [Planctomycetota bacterium]